MLLSRIETKSPDSLQHLLEHIPGHHHFGELEHKPLGMAHQPSAIKAFNSLSHGERRFLTNGRLKKRTVDFVSSGAPKRPPYQLAFSTMLYVAAEKADGNVKVNYVLDQNKVEMGLALDVFKATQEKQGIPEWTKLSRIEFANSDLECGLQAADLYAYLTNAMLTRRHDMDSQQRAALERLTAKNRYSLDLWEVWNMEEALSKLSDEQRIGLKVMK